MSGINGDKARFNRRRRQKISRRQSNEKMLKTLAAKHLVPPAAQANLKEKVALPHPRSHCRSSIRMAFQPGRNVCS
jgi:hypothetical protein